MDEREQGKRRLAAAACMVCSVGISAAFFSVMCGAVTGKSIAGGIAAAVPELVCMVIMGRKGRAAAACSSAADGHTADAGAAGSEGEKDRKESPGGKETGKEIDEEEGKACREAGREIGVRMQLAGPVMAELSRSISESLSRTTEPITAELLHIRETGNAFLESIRAYEGEVRNRTAAVKLQQEEAAFDEDLKELSVTTETVFSELGEHVEKLRTVSDRVGGIAGDISEISEQIRILSINASIEAARAGNAGGGFRVIAGEIKRLSAGTNERLEEIRGTLGETQRIFGEIGTGLTENRKKMGSVVSERQKRFAELAGNLESYFPKLEKLYTGAGRVIDGLSKSMDVISPVVQQHEITGQEIGNLGAVAADLCAWTRQRAEAWYGENAGEAGQEETAAFFSEARKRLTTEEELKALERGIRKSVPEAEIDVKSNTKDIELF